MAFKAPTSIDIAARAGVSQSTVSRALRGSPQVSEETRQRVRAAAAALNYRVDHRASSLRRGSSDTLALLLFDDSAADGANINPFLQGMTYSIARACADRGYDLLLSFQQLEEDWHAHYRTAHRADGLILLGYGDYTHSRRNLERLAAAGTRFVMWGPVIKGQPWAAVGCDNRRGGFQATRHLLERGCRRIGFIGTASEVAPEFRERFRGHVAALGAAGMATSTPLHAEGDNSEAAGRAGIAALLHAEPKLDAVFCASDLIAMGAIDQLQALGRSVPEDIAVMGFDDIGAAAHCRPPLTTMRQDTAKAGTVLVEKLLATIHHGRAESVRLRPQLVARASA